MGFPVVDCESGLLTQWLRSIRFTTEPHIRTYPFGIILLQPRLRSVDIREHLDKVGVADLFARIDVNEHGHLTIL
jgi:hypothetical protein